MTDEITAWMMQNPKAIMAMGVPIILQLGNVLFQNRLMRSLCGIIAALLMVIVVVMTLVTQEWFFLMWPGIGFITWTVIGSMKKSFS